MLLAAGYAGGLHPAGDSLAVFAGLFAAAILLALPFARLSVWASVAAVLAIGAAMTPRVIDWVYPGDLTASAGDRVLTLYQKNLFSLPADRGPLIEDIRASGADIVTLEEVSAANRPVIAALKADFPHQVYCPFESYGGIAVLSRWPIVEDSEVCLSRKGLVSARFRTPAGDVRAAAIHLHWPWPFEQARDVAFLLPQLRRLDRPAIVAGDFNMVKRSAHLREIMAATGTWRAGPVRPTFNLPLFRMGIAIDHVLVPKGARARVERRPKFASDHRGLVARIELPTAR